MSPADLPFFLSGAFLTSLVLSIVGTYAVRGWAIRRGYVDHPDDVRRVHSQPTPNVGGIAVVFATLISFVLWGFVVVPDAAGRPEIVSMLVGGFMIFAVGFWDDVHHLRATTKLILQLLIAGLVFAGGVRIPGVGFGTIWFAQISGAVGLMVTIAWVVGTTNAFNLIDGSDGVAGGAALFASASMGIIFALHGDPLGALMATILIGACLGFLVFNFPPASVFMGDSGSLFLGFTLATLGVITTQKSSTLIAVTIPVIAFGVPLLDTVIAVVRRYLRHEPIFAADRGHIHHRLRDLGMSPRRVAVFLYVGCAGCASLSLLLAAPGRTTVLPVFIVAGAVLILVVQRLNVPELTELSRVLGRGLQQRSVISHNVRLHGASDGIESARTSEAVIDALTTAFEGSEFSALELWVGRDLRGVLDHHPAAMADDDGLRVRVVFERLLNVDQQYELRLPFHFADGTPGRLSLFRRSSGSRLFTDVGLAARLLTAALSTTLYRLSEGGRQDETQVR